MPSRRPVMSTVQCPVHRRPSRPAVLPLLPILQLLVVLCLSFLSPTYAAGEKKRKATKICDPGMYKMPLDRVPQEPIDGVPQDAWSLGGDDCHVHMFDMPELRECMANEWLVIYGGSNAVSTAGAALGMFWDLPYEIDRSVFLGCPGCTDEFGFVSTWDAIISKDGKTVEYVKSTPVEAIMSPMLFQDESAIDPANWPSLRDMLQEAPIPNPGSVRITWIYCSKSPATSDGPNIARYHKII